VPLEDSTLAMWQGKGLGGIDTDIYRLSSKEGNKFDPLILYMLLSWQSHKTMEPMIFAFLLAGVRFDLNRV